MIAVKFCPKSRAPVHTDLYLILSNFVVFLLSSTSDLTIFQKVNTLPDFLQFAFSVVYTHVMTLAILRVTVNFLCVHPRVGSDSDQGSSV